MGQAESLTAFLLQEGLGVAAVVLSHSLEED